MTTVRQLTALHSTDESISGISMGLVGPMGMESITLVL